MNLDKLKQLETLLAESEEFSDIFTYFMDNFGDKPNFVRDSKKAKPPLIMAMIKEGALVVFQKIPLRITNVTTLSFDRLSILHGGGFVEGQLFQFFYCKRINKGMLIIASPTGSTEMVRITPQAMDNTQKLEADFMESVESVTMEFRNPNPN
jgi:hypothetical protein